MALALALLTGVAACDDNPFEFKWDETPITVLLYSMSRPELNLVSGYNFYRASPIRIEAATATGQWDVAVDTRDGRIVMVNPGVFGVVSTARIAVLSGRSLDDVKEAPADTLLYVGDQAVPIEVGNVYIVKTNRQRGSFGSSCVYYAKVEPVVVDLAGGTLTFRYVANPICNSQDLVPPN